MMTRQLLFGVFLGLLVAVHSSPLGTASDISSQPEESIEAKTEGFLVNGQTGPSNTTESFKTNTTSQAPQFLDDIPKQTTEGSHQTPSSEWSEGSGQNPIGTSAVPTQDSSLTTESDEAPETRQTTQRPHLESTTEGSDESQSSEYYEGSGQNPIGTSAVPTQDSSLTTESDEAPETPGTPQTTQWPHLELTTEGNGESQSSEYYEGSGQNPIGTSAVPTQDSSLTTESDEAPETPGTPQTTQWPHLELTTEGNGESQSSEYYEGSGQNPIGTSAVPTQDLSLTTKSDEAPETPQTTQWPHLESTTEGNGESQSSEYLEGSGQNPIGTSAVPTQDSSLTTESDEAPETPGSPQTTQRPHLERTTEGSGESTPFSPELKKARSAILGRKLPPQKAIPDYRHLDSSESKTTSKTTHSRADWLIILGFAVGIVALLGLCVAVATRDKWNTNSSSNSVKKSNLLNQKREQEMQTFLHKNEPKENGQNGEYTVIPLNDIPEKYFSN